MRSNVHLFLKVALWLSSVVGVIMMQSCAINEPIPSDAIRIIQPGKFKNVNFLNDEPITIKLSTTGTSTYEVAMGGAIEPELGDKTATIQFDEYEGTSWSILESPDVLPVGCTISFNPVHLDNSTGTTTMSIHLEPTVKNGSYVVTIQTNHPLYSAPKKARIKLEISLAHPEPLWNDVTPSKSLPALNGVGFATQLIGVIVGDNGTLLRSVDGGMSWETISLPTSKDLRSVKFVNSSLGFAVGKEIVLKTTDGGAHWVEPYTTLTGDFRGLCAIDTGFVILYEGNLKNSRVVSISPSGNSWTLLGTFGAVNKVIMANDTVGIRIGGSPGASFTEIFHTNDGCSTWTTNPNHFEPGMNDALYTSPKQMYACGYAGSVYSSSNSGSTWTTNTVTGIRDNLYSLSFSGTHGIAIGGIGSVARTTGSGWSAENSGVSYSLNAVAVLNDSNAIAVGYGYLPGSSSNSGVIIRRK